MVSGSYLKFNDSEAEIVENWVCGRGPVNLLVEGLEATLSRIEFISSVPRGNDEDIYGEIVRLEDNPIKSRALELF